ncbi:MAG: CPBP family intramembrane metalloprotease, partial [Oscillospiraceae bacterium]|nr:CPBP family intramembrane metalloprotease [Oscillospiraceae bacterium]
MKKFYEKSELWFSIAWIIAYCVIASVCDNISKSLGIQKIITVPVLVVLSIIFYAFCKKNNLLEKYGLCKSQI